MLLSFQDYWVASEYHSNAGISAFFINTQLQLGEEEAGGGPLNRFNGFADDGLKLLKQFVRTLASHLTEVRC